MIGVGRTMFMNIAAGALLAMALVALPFQLGDESQEETIAPSDEFDATPVAIAIDVKSGEGVEVNVTLNVRSLAAGSILVEADLGERRHLVTVTSDYEGAEESGNDRLPWTCDSTECSIAATVRVDAFTEIRGQIFIGASGGPLSGELAPDAAADITAGDAVVGRAKAFELAHSFLEYPDNGDQAPHGGLELIEYDLGDPSDAVELVVRPILGNISIEGGAGPTPQWAAGVLLIAQSELCKPTCAGSAIVQMGPADFSNLEYQVIAYSERPGAGASAAATRTAASAVTEIGFVTMTPDRPVAAIPITVSGDAERIRIMGGVGVRGRTSFVNLRGAGETAFEPATSWIAPQPGVAEYELAISTPDTQDGNIDISWTIALFEIPGDAPAAATIAIGEPTATAFAAGGLGDPSEFEPLDGAGGGSALPWAIGGLGLLGVAGYGGYRYNSRTKES